MEKNKKKERLRARESAGRTREGKGFPRVREYSVLVLVIPEVKISPLCQGVIGILGDSLTVKSVPQ